VDCPNVGNVIDSSPAAWYSSFGLKWGEEGDEAPQVPGEDLKSMIRMSGTLSLGAALSIGKQVVDRLAEAHRLGVIHRRLPSHPEVEDARKMLEGLK